MKGFLRGFGGAIAMAVAALVCAYYVEADSGPVAGMTAVLVVAMLGLLEAALSFDSAALNAKVLAGMSLLWRRVFIAAGVLVAILGMRFVFPLLIVWAVSDHGFWTVVSMVVLDSLEFRVILRDQFVLVAGFGGAFLCMAFTQFFLDKGKQEHWIQWLERPLGKLGQVRLVSVVATAAISHVFSQFIPNAQEHAFLSAAMLGIVTHLLVEMMTAFVQSNWEKISKEGARPGLPGLPAALDVTSLTYLLLVGTSFSFSGVMGAFSFSSNLVIILLGLGLGVLFMQSFSLKLIAEAAPRTCTFLKHGVSWAKGVMSLGLYLQAAEWMVPEILIGTVGTGFIGSSVVSSLRQQRSRKQGTP